MPRQPTDVPDLSQQERQAGQVAKAPGEAGQSLSETQNECYSVLARLVLRGWKHRPYPLAHGAKHAQGAEFLFFARKSLKSPKTAKEKFGNPWKILGFPWKYLEIRQAWQT
jgi:hypothetical protein